MQASLSSWIGQTVLSAVPVIHGPVGLLGRFFLVATDRLAAEGVTIEFASFEEVATLRLANAENWAFFNPMFNPAIADIPDDRAFCIVCRNATGRIVGTVAAKLLDASTRSLKEIVDAGDFYAVRPECNETGIAAYLDAKQANHLRGRLVFCGGIWVDPSVRGLRLAAVLGKLVNAVALTLWNPDYSIGLVRCEAASTDYLRRYGYTHTAPSLAFYQHGRLSSEAVVIWMSADDVGLDIARCLDSLWPQVDAAIVARRGQHAAHPATLHDANNNTPVARA
jgi:hypothetical protein